MEKRHKLSSNIPGTRPSIHNSQLLVSSGIQSLDDLIGGGFPVGSLVLIQEDSRGIYSRTLLKYFLAEGFVHKHGAILASLDKNPNAILEDLPTKINEPEEEDKNSKSQDLKIAFRYQNLATSNPTTKRAPHHFDLSKKVTQSDVEIYNVKVWNGTNEENGEENSYEHLLKFVKSNLDKYSLENPSQKDVLRIAVHALGSPFWSSNPKEHEKELTLFVYRLRALTRRAYATTFVTIPSYLHSEGTISRCVHCSDVVLNLQAFSGTELEANKCLSDYHGFFNVLKVAATNTFLSKHPGKVEYVFKLRRKKLVIEKLHLPPDVQEDGKPSLNLGCGSSDKHLLDF